MLVFFGRTIGRVCHSINSFQGSLIVNGGRGDLSRALPRIGRRLVWVFFVVYVRAAKEFVHRCCDQVVSWDAHRDGTLFLSSQRLVQFVKDALYRSRGVRCSGDVFIYLFQECSYSGHEGRRVLRYNRLQRRLVGLGGRACVLVARYERFFFFRPTRCDSIGLRVAYVQFIRHSRSLRRNDLAYPAEACGASGLTFIGFRVGAFRSLR